MSWPTHTLPAWAYSSEMAKLIQKLHDTGVVEYATFGPPPSYRLIFQTEMDRVTEDLEHAGYHIWFTCEVDGTEYRLASRKEEQ